jgi:hypothetical protein
MSTFEEERLRILARVQAGELTPQEGSLQIAMLKVKAQEAPEEPQAPREPLGSLPKAPNPLAIGLLLLVPFVVMGLIVTVGMLMFMALPAYLAMAAWNGIVVATVPGTEAVGFLPVLAGFAAFGFLWTVLRWRRKVRVFMTGSAMPGGPFGFGARAPRPGRAERMDAGLNPGDPFREQ